jgi:hypothetical protein
MQKYEERYKANLEKYRDSMAKTYGKDWEKVHA